MDIAYGIGVYKKVKIINTLAILKYTKQQKHKFKFLNAVFTEKSILAIKQAYLL